MANSVFLDAIKILERQGWCQGSYYRGEERCLVSALAQAEGEVAFLTSCSFETERVVRSIVNSPSLETYNDDPFTTYEDVILALKRAHEVTALKGETNG